MMTGPRPNIPAATREIVKTLGASNSSGYRPRTSYALKMEECIMIKYDMIITDFLAKRLTYET